MSRVDKFKNLKKVSKILPKDAREYFVKAYKLTEEPDCIDFDIADYMDIIYESLKMRRNDCILYSKQMTKAIDALENI